MTEQQWDAYFEEQPDESRHLIRVAAGKGWRLDYLRKMAMPDDDITLSIDERMAQVAKRIPTDIVQARLVEAGLGSPFYFWVSSESDAATVLQEVTNYLELLAPDDPGIRRAKAEQGRWKDIQEIAVRPGEARLWISSSEEGGASQSLTEMGRIKEEGRWKRRPS